VVRQALGRSAALGGGAAKAIAASSLKYPLPQDMAATHQEAGALKTVKAPGVAVPPFAHRRADRIKMLLAAVHEPLHGPGCVKTQKFEAR
jgi:hypothetical protein